MSSDLDHSRRLTFIQETEADDRRKISDRRHAPRRKILKGARAYWKNGGSAECIVRNLSDAGAQLEIVRFRTRLIW
jgi:hypothetical protein